MTSWIGSGAALLIGMALARGKLFKLIKV